MTTRTLHLHRSTILLTAITAPSPGWQKPLLPRSRVSSRTGVGDLVPAGCRRLAQPCPFVSTKVAWPGIQAVPLVSLLSLTTEWEQPARCGCELQPAVTFCWLQCIDVTALMQSPQGRCSAMHASGDDVACAASTGVMSLIHWANCARRSFVLGGPWGKLVFRSVCVCALNCCKSWKLLLKMCSRADVLANV